MASCLKPTIAGGRGLDVVTDPRGAPNCRFYVSLCASKAMAYCNQMNVNLYYKISSWQFHLML